MRLNADLERESAYILPHPFCHDGDKIAFNPGLCCDPRLKDPFCHSGVMTRDKRGVLCRSPLNTNFRPLVLGGVTSQNKDLVSKFDTIPDRFMGGLRSTFNYRVYVIQVLVLMLESNIYSTRNLLPE
jgi:hypothetical protein